MKIFSFFLSTRVSNYKNGFVSPQLWREAGGEAGYVLFFLFLFQLIFFQPISAQNQFSFHHLSVEDGLSQSTVNCIFQDKQGFLWIGTNDGLNKYDGKKFTSYKHEPNDSNSISAPVVLSVVEADDGDLLIGTDRGGLNVFNKIKETFKIYTKTGDSTSLSSKRVSCILHLKGSSYLIATFGGGVNFFDKQTGKFKWMKHDDANPNSLSNNNVMKIIKSHDGLVWIATRYGLNVFNPTTGGLKIYLHDSTNVNSLPDNHLQDVFEDSEHRIWLGCLNSGIVEFNRRSEKFIVYATTKNDVVAGPNYANCYFEDSHKQLWIGTNGNGIKILNKQTGIVSQFKSDATDAGSLNSNEIFSITEDRSGIIWIGTNSGGLNFYHNSFTAFNKFTNSVQKNFQNKNIYALLSPYKNTLCIGTLGGGLVKMNINDGEISSFINHKQKPKSISDNNILALAAKDSDELWVGTFGGGLNIYQEKKKLFYAKKYHLEDSTATSSGNVQCIFTDSKNMTWVGTQSSGVDVFDKNAIRKAHYTFNENDSTSLSSVSVLSIVEDDANQIWVGTQGGGLNLFNPNTNQFSYFKNNPHDKFSISNNDVFCICPSKNILWIGTNGGGLNAFDKNTNRFIHFTERNGLPNNAVYGILADAKCNLWLSTNKGICKFTPPKKLVFNETDVVDEDLKQRIRNFDMSDGISSNEFNQGAYCKDGNGNFYFGSINGITAFHPDSVKENTFLPPVVFTRFKIFEKDYALDSAINFKKEITLSYSQDFFSFEFAALNYLLPEKNKYAVMMDGFDKSWINIGTRNYASYTNLNPGTYFFKVSACNNDGVWNENFSSIKIIITPPWWMTWWFKAAATLAIAIAVYAIYFFRVRNIKLQEQKKTKFNKALAQVEMKALRSQMNPHFIFNSLNSINKYIVTNNQQKASDYLARFSKLVRLVLENSMHQSVTLEKEMEALELYIQMERLRFEKQFDYKITIAQNVDTEGVLMPPLLLQPFVENAILHGLMPKQSAGKISINIFEEENLLHCIVEDDGIGRQKAAAIKQASVSKHKSIGLKVTMDRISILNYQKDKASTVEIFDLKDDNGNATGTKVELKIPLEHAY